MKTIFTNSHINTAVLSLLSVLLIAVALLQSTHVFAAAPPAIEITCTATFAPSEAWNTYQSGCEAVVNLSGCDNAPTVTITGNACLPPQGSMAIGYIDVYEDNVLSYRYVAKSVNGSVVTVLVEDL